MGSFFVENSAENDPKGCLGHSRGEISAVLGSMASANSRSVQLVQVPEHVERNGAVLDGREGGGAHVRLDLCYFADSE